MRISDWSSDVCSSDLLQSAGVVTLVGDWTNSDPQISRFLAKHGRNSIPFYLYYAPGKPPVVLPQLLGPQTLSDVVKGGGPRFLTRSTEFHEENAMSHPDPITDVTAAHAQAHKNWALSLTDTNQTNTAPKPQNRKE